MLSSSSVEAHQHQRDDVAGMSSERTTKTKVSRPQQQHFYDITIGTTAGDQHDDRIRESTTLSAHHRLHYLDSLRGILAVVVVYHHFRCAFYPCTMFGPSVEWVSDVTACPSTFLSDTSTTSSSMLWNSVTNGTLAVSIFYIMSGFVLSNNLWKSDMESWRLAVAKRLIRLAIPCSGALVVAYILAGWHVHERVAYITHSLWLERFAMARPSPITGLLSQIFVGIWHGNVTLNNAMWTMQYELFGSYLTFLVVLLLKRSTHRTRTLTLLAVVVYCFVPTYQPTNELEARVWYTETIAHSGRPGEKITRQMIQHTVRLNVRKHSHVLRQMQEFATAGHHHPPLDNILLIHSTVTFGPSEFTSSSSSLAASSSQTTEVVLDQPHSWWQQRSNVQVYRDVLHAAEHGYAGSTQWSPPVVELIHNRQPQSRNGYLWYAAFFFGVWMSERVKRWERKEGNRRRSQYWTAWGQWSLPVVALVCSSYPYTAVMAVTSPWIWKPMTNFARHLGYHDHEAHALFSVIAGMAVMVYLVEATDGWRTRLANQPYLVLLGKLSFSLYLTHIPILFTVTCRIFLWLHSFQENTAVASVGALLLSLPIMVGVAMAFWTFVDEPSIRWSQQLARQMLGHQPPPLRPAARRTSTRSEANGAVVATTTAEALAPNHHRPDRLLPIPPDLAVSETSEGSSSSLL
jgi:peptidoglycan/LPS O-acetylase OafA/YrhL